MKKFTKVSLYFMLASFVFAILPLIGLLIAIVISSILGCDVNEGGIGTCNFLGANIGGFLYVLSVSTWYSLITLPIGGAGVVIGFIAFIIFKITGRKKVEKTTE